MALRKRYAKRAFTMIEVLVAVAIMALAGTAAIKLVLLAQNSLEETEEQERLIDEAESLQVGIRLGETADSGVSGDITWETAYRQREIMGDGFGELDLSGKSVNVTAGLVRWKELTVKNKKGAAITLYLPVGNMKNN